MRVLLVDHDPRIRRVVRRVVEQKTTFTVIGEAEDGAAAVEEAQLLRPDVIIMDVDIPVMDGIEAAEKIKKLLPTTHVLGFTSSTAESVRDRLRDVGATVCIDKSRLNDLVASLNEISGAVPSSPRGGRPG